MLRCSRTARSIALALTLTGASLVAGSGPASSAPSSYPSRMNSNATTRLCVKHELEGCAKRSSIPAGTSVHMHCWATGTRAGDGVYNTDRYAWITTKGGIRGFVLLSRVANQTTVGKCSEHHGVATLRWAAEQIGRDAPRPHEKVSSDHDRWSGWCQAFVWNAHARVNTSGAVTGRNGVRGKGTALATYEAYRKAGKTNPVGNHADIPIGAAIYWGGHDGSGHAAVYAGQGDVVTTRGTDRERRDIDVVPMATFGTPLGYVAPDSF